MSFYFYEPVNRELRTVPSELLQRAPLVRIQWLPTIQPLGMVIAGTALGIAYFNDGSVEPMLSPHNCAGVISAVRKKIPYAQLATGPSVWLFRLH
jgi:hypothetical protein